MNKSYQILKREFLYRVTKKSFVIMTLLGPIFFAFLLIIPAWLSLSGLPKTKVVQVLDKTGSTDFNATSIDNFILKIQDSSRSFSESLTQFSNSESSIFLYLSKNKQGMVLLKEPISLAEEVILKEMIQKEFIRSLLSEADVPPDLKEKICTGPTLNIQKLYTEDSGSRDILTGVSILLGVIIYLFILTYTIQVMKGVAEEKGSRVAEILLTSVQPFQLMLGKILGIASVSILQFIIWTILSGCIYLAFFQNFGESLALFNDSNIEETLKIKGINAQEALEWNAIVSSFSEVDVSMILSIFPFYFVFGYLLYASIFAALGAIVDSETETQQFVFPLTLPILICFAMMQVFANEPSGKVATFFALFPLTSPVAIMMLLPLGISNNILIGSMIFLILSFIVIVWIAARIYRVGILFYGSRPSLKEVMKWVIKVP